VGLRGAEQLYEKRFATVGSQLRRGTPQSGSLADPKRVDSGRLAVSDGRPSSGRVEQRKNQSRTKNHKNRVPAKYKSLAAIAVSDSSTRWGFVVSYKEGGAAEN